MARTKVAAVHQLSQWFGGLLIRRRLNFFFTVFLTVQALLFVGLEAVPGMLDRQGRVRGRDFLQFYVGGRIIAEGKADQLYDQEFFGASQRALVEINERSPPYFSTYPPLVPLLFAPLGRLPYGAAIVVWWFLQAVCFLAAGRVLFRIVGPSPGWQYTTGMGLAAFYPVLNTFWNGQLAAVFLVIFLFGLELYRRHRLVAAGLVLSLLALKPQLVVGVVIWLLIRREGRALAGLATGLLCQAAVVTLLLSPEVLLAYGRTLPSYGQLFRIHQITPDHQHALAGILKDRFGEEYSNWAMLAQLLLAGLAGVLLFRLPRSDPEPERRQVLAAAVVFTLLATPHLLTYDLSYLLIPVAYLLAIMRAGRNPDMLVPVTLLYGCATVAPLYGLLGFSPMPAVMLVALYCLTLLNLRATRAASDSE